MSTRSATLLVMLALAGARCRSSSTAVLDDDPPPEAADGNPGNWLPRGRPYHEQCLSPLRANTPATVGRLGLAWSYDLGMNRGAEATPIVRDGVMYVTSAWSIVHALDAKTG